MSYAFQYDMPSHGYQTYPVNESTQPNNFWQPPPIPELAAPSPAQLPAKKKRTRTHFREEQLQRMEEMFRANKRPSDLERKDLAVEIGLTGQQVKIWFQNRRYKEKTIGKASKKQAEAAHQHDVVPSVSTPPQTANGPTSAVSTFQSNVQWCQPYNQYSYPMMYDPVAVMCTDVNQPFARMPVAQNFNPTMTFAESQQFCDMGIASETMYLTEQTKTMYLTQQF